MKLHDSPAAVLGIRAKESSMQKIIALGCAAAIVLAATSSQVFAQSVCYRVGEDDERVLRVFVRQNAILTTRQERREFGPDHPIQRVYLVNGRSLRSTEEGFIKGTINGTVILGQGIGAQMSLTDLQHHDFAGFQGHLSHCESGENAVSSTPDEWFCQGVTFVPSEPLGDSVFRLERIDPLDNELCSRFTLDD